MAGKLLLPPELCLLKPHLALARLPTAVLLLASLSSQCSTCKGMLGLWAELMARVMQVRAE